MAVNLIDSNDIEVSQTGSNIKLNLTSSSMANKNIYSTSETRIGTFLGKPLYRKVIVFPNGTGQITEKTYSLSDFEITNVDEIYIAQPSYYSANNIRWPFSYYDGNTFMASVNPTSLNITITLQIFSTSRTVITLEYTKTTD